MESSEGVGKVEEIEPRGKVRCPNSSPSHPHTFSFLFLTTSRCHGCKSQSASIYHCKTCMVPFRDCCQSILNKITHPYHLQHPLAYTQLNTPSEINNFIQTESPSIFDRCSWCGNETQTWVYSCSICSFCLCLPCSGNIPLLVIPNPKSHHHQLYFLPRPLLGPCDACGLVTASGATYACLQCNYMVHESCMDLPRAIKLTRHPHRLFLLPFLPPASVLCRVCYKAVNIRYGQYSCLHEDCSYVIHSKCATHGAVWDGRDLEWEPEVEETEEEEDVASFTKVGGTDQDLIKYFSHAHHLKLEKYDGVRDANKQCEACILPIDDSSCFYNCIECDYFLHEVCARLPRKLDHLLHKHRLFLSTTPDGDDVPIRCSACSRMSTGFMYTCNKTDCHFNGFMIDFRCILLPHYFTHKSHQHSLFSSISDVSGGGLEATCWICGEKYKDTRLCCTLCEFWMCYQCATIPTEILYKYDKHPLSLCYGETIEGVGIYWCEVCEGKIDSSKWFYTCNICCVTIHRECIFGSSAYMQSGSAFCFYYIRVEVIPNNSCTRPLCGMCQNRCTDSVCYRFPYEDGWSDKAFCSLSCSHRVTYHIM